MRRIFVILFVCLSTLGFTQTATITGKVVDPSTSNQAINTKLQMELVGCSGNSPRVNGTALIWPVIKKYDTDASGNASGTIYRSDYITCGTSTASNKWRMTVIQNGQAGPPCDVRITTTTFDATQPNCLNAQPTIAAPTDTAIWAKLDSTNTPFTGNTLVTKLNYIRFADQFASIQAAITDASTTGAVLIPPSYALTDSYTNPNNIPIIDLRGGETAYRGYVSPKDFGAKWDGTTDDSTAIQAAITYAISTRACVILPVGTAVFATTLNMNSTTNGVCMKGQGNHATLASKSVLKYTGSGDALLLSNGTGFIYGSYWDNFAILAGANATSAVHGTNVSEGVFNRVGIWSDGTHQFTHGWFGTGWNINFWDKWIVANVTNAVRFTHSAQANTAGDFFRHGNTFQVTNVFNLDGQLNQLVDTDGWHETQNVVLLVDDTTNATSFVNVRFSGSRFTFNGSLATYPDSLVMKVNNVAGNAMTLHQVGFDGVGAFWSNAIAYPFSITFANATSTGWLGIGGESSFIGANTGLITTSTVSGAQLKFRGGGLESLNSSFAALSTLVGGSGAQYVGLESSTGLNINGVATIDTTGKGTFGNGLTMGGSFILGATGHLLFNNTAPTISSGFGTSPTIATNNGTAAFSVNVGTGGTATNGVIGLPTATNGWNCSCVDITTQSTTVFYCKQKATATTSATIANYNTAGAEAAWVASDIVQVSCFAR